MRWCEGGHQQGADGEEVIKRKLVGRWSPEGSWCGGGHQKGAHREVVIKRELKGRSL